MEEPVGLPEGLNSGGGDRGKSALHQIPRGKVLVSMCIWDEGLGVGG